MCAFTVEYPLQNNTDMSDAWGDTHSRAAGCSSNAPRTFLKLNNWSWTSIKPIVIKADGYC